MYSWFWFYDVLIRVLRDTHYYSRSNCNNKPYKYWFPLPHTSLLVNNIECSFFTSSYFIFFPFLPLFTSLQNILLNSLKTSPSLLVHLWSVSALATRNMFPSFHTSTFMYGSLRSVITACKVVSLCISQSQSLSINYPCPSDGEYTEIDDTKSASFPMC